MLFDKGKMRDDVRSFSPAPYDETEEYRRFLQVFGPLSSGIMIAVSYIGFYFRASLEPFSSKLVVMLPFAGPRLLFLEQWDKTSYEAYVSTVFCGLICQLALLTILASAYYKLVTLQGVCRPVTRRSAYVVVKGLLLLVLFWGGAFLYVPEPYDPRWPGTARFLLWPFFPAIGAGTIWLSSGVIFSSLVGIIKTIWQVRDRSDEYGR